MKNIMDAWNLVFVWFTRFHTTYFDKHCENWYELNLPDIAHDQCPLSQTCHSEKVQHAASSDCVLCLQLTDHSFTLQIPLKNSLNVVLLRHTSITLSSRESETFLPLTLAAFRIIFLASFCLPWVRSHRADSGRILKTESTYRYDVYYSKRFTDEADNNRTIYLSSCWIRTSQGSLVVLIKNQTFCRTLTTELPGTTGF